LPRPPVVLKIILETGPLGSHLFIDKKIQSCDEEPGIGREVPEVRKTSGQFAGGRGQRVRGQTIAIAVLPIDVIPCGFNGRYSFP
jgi:hypothetical protein